MYLFLPVSDAKTVLSVINFTFQNVSISTRMTSSTKSTGFPLHSKMYLFLLDAGIPYALTWIVFTFQNVSISTQSAVLDVFNASPFTFQNVSISTRPIFSLLNTVITSPVLSTSFLISILSQISTCDNIHFTYHTLSPLLKPRLSQILSTSPAFSIIEGRQYISRYSQDHLPSTCLTLLDKITPESGLQKYYDPYVYRESL